MARHRTIASAPPFALPSHPGNDIGTPNPMGFFQVRLRPLRRMVRMRMIKADDIQSATPCLLLDADQFLRRNLIAIVSGVGSGIFSRNRVDHGVAVLFHVPQQAHRSTHSDRSLPHAGESRRIVICPMRSIAILIPAKTVHLNIYPHHRTTRSRSRLSHFSPHTLPRFALKHATAAAAEMPTIRPFSRASRRAIAYAASVSISILRSARCAS